jgi:hypothetical protein
MASKIRPPGIVQKRWSNRKYKRDGGSSIEILEECTWMTIRDRDRASAAVRGDDHGSFLGRGAGAGFVTLIPNTTDWCTRT